MFEHSARIWSAGEQLLALRQGKGKAAKYTLAFCTLTAQTEWIEDTLKLLFWRGLCLYLQAELACRNEGKTLNELELTIQIDNLVRSR